MREIYQILFDGTYPPKKLYILPVKHGIQVKICKKFFINLEITSVTTLVTVIIM